METGLITFFRHHHYGAQLQAYAAMRAMTELGHPCRIIDYRPDYDLHLNDLFRPGGVRTQLSNLHTASHYTALKRRAQRFDDFVTQHMPLTDRRYTSYEQLCEDPPPFDVYVAGSDQIWNPSIYPGGTFDPAYLLSFVREGRRISYAPSMGSRPFTEAEDQTLKTALEPFSALSVREAAGRERVLNATGREPAVVLDPTLLLTAGQWAELAAPPPLNGPYILCYYISDHSALDPYAIELANRTGWPIIQLGTRRKAEGVSQLVLDAGPQEFLGLFRYAAFVLTNSFHGTVFSIQFGRDFYTSVSPQERSDPSRSRVYSLLDRLGCTQRVVGLGDADVLGTPVDYGTVEQNLTLWRNYSLAYLRAAVEGTPLPLPPTQEKKKELPRLASHAACTGCTACAQSCPVGAISMRPDQEGFLRPVVGDACILCHKCESACPVGKISGREKPTTVWAVWNRDEEVRALSSSGGFFSVLASHVICQGGAVFGAVYDEDFHGVHYACARTWDEVSPMRGSKYVQSDLGDSFRQIKSLLDQGIPVLFSGLPCQVAGLYGYLGGDRENLLTCDLVCHGVPSPMVFSDFIRQLEATCGASVSALTFKDKRKGWSTPHLTAELDGGAKQWSMPLNDTPYGRGFGMQLFLRPSCGQCEYADPARPADFTLADFWGLDPNLKLDTDREKGISMVLVGSEKGRDLFDVLSPAYVRVERPLDEAVKGNPRLSSPLKHNAKRDGFFSAMFIQGFSAASRQFLSRPSLPYRMAAKILTPGAKERIRKFLK